MKKSVHGSRVPTEEVKITTINYELPVWEESKTQSLGPYKKRGRTYFHLEHRKLYLSRTHQLLVDWNNFRQSGLEVKAMDVIPFMSTSFYQFGLRFSLLFLTLQCHFPSVCFPFRVHRDPISMIKRREKISPRVLINFQLIKRVGSVVWRQELVGSDSREPGLNTCSAT